MPFFWLAIALVVISDNYRTEETSTPTHEPFNIVDYNWLTGSGVGYGDGFGGIFEESWLEPVTGILTGMCRHNNAEGELVFYEFLLLDETGIRLKHFNQDLNGLSGLFICHEFDLLQN